MYGILRTNKVKMMNINASMSNHNQRTNSADCHSNTLTRPDLSEYNVQLVNCENWREGVKNVLEDHQITKTRKDAVGLIDCIITASHNYFKGKNIDDITNFFKEALPLFQEKFGVVLSATIHLDEETPHMHVDCVPIVQNDDGTYSLSAKRVMGNKSAYIQRQDYFYEKFFSKYGLDRGESKEITGREHIDHRQYKLKEIREQYNCTCQAIKDTQEKLNTLNEQKARYEAILKRAIDDGRQSEYMLGVDIGYSQEEKLAMEKDIAAGKHAENRLESLNDEWSL